MPPFNTHAQNQRGCFLQGIRWLYLFFALLIFVVMSYLTFGFVKSYRDQVRASRTFQPVPARVLESKVKRISGDKGSDSFLPYVRYTYEVDGKRYESDTFFFTGWGYNDYLEAKKKVDNYPVGATVTAYYDPNAPEITVLDNSFPTNASFAFAIFGVFWSIAIVVFLYAIWPVVRGEKPASREE
ncbi:hypothetical protein ARMA_0659 [Ardenticatena maritima]|uniref:DUF3592 domain-containing protein n=1 Tax=Ardenticatena maritima TaxID=872965 RepID=A0A0M8K837_9CHLR|nr:DUF3592 domain-containing protein [Ardenticatena maritima]KPL86472.1 hypothetical protein SE16_14420 [Ardenticatena maritima]GAP62236.1 hypothetical protein ARMA_0659 [Ardenticatena maritima]